LGIALVERIDAREPEKEKHSSSGQMELDEQPNILYEVSINLLARVKR
jgi:hypothetical protein